MQLAKVWRKTAGMLAAIGLVSAGWIQAQTPPGARLPGHVPAVVPGLHALGRLDGSNQLPLAISLPLHHPEALSNLLEQIYDPASPEYHHYLTPEAFDARFGPTTNDYLTLIAWAVRNGLTVTGRHPNRLLLEVRAPVATIERALQVTLRTYAHPTEARTFFAPDTEPTVTSGTPIAAIGGLDNFGRAHPANLRRKLLSQTASDLPGMGSGPNGNLAGGDYRAAYLPGVTLTGTGQQVGLLELDACYPSDITAYENQMNLPQVPLQTVLLNGFDGQPSTGTNSSNGEVALDIEMAVSMAPGLSQVVLFEADPNASIGVDVAQILQAMAANTAIKQFSCSWVFAGISVAQRGVVDTYFQELASQGQSFFAASGDGGAANSMTPPCDDPYVTLVGGTTLATTGPGGAWLSETAWNIGAGPGIYDTAGGVSSTYAIPTWQQGVNMTTNQGSKTKRNCPDVAMVADNIFMVADNGHQETTGGTSAAAPLWAAFMALVNEQEASLGRTSFGFANPALYHIGTNSGYTADFDDITVGNNTNTSATRYLAVPGYDLCTGWGSPVGGSLILALTQPDGFQITPGRGAVANGQVGGPFTVLTQMFGLTNTGTSAFNWSVAGTPGWLNLSGTGGTLAAGGGTSVTVSLNSAAGTLQAGVYTANLWFTNLTSHQGQLRQFTLLADQNLVQDGGFESANFAYWNLTGVASVYDNNFVDFSDDPSTVDYPSEAGDCFALLSQISTLSGLSQTLPTRAGQYYRLSFWLANPAEPWGVVPNQFQVQWNSNSTSANLIYNQNNLSAFDWTNLQFLVLAVTNLTTLEFASRNDSNFFALDGISVTPVPTQTLGVFSVFLNEVINAAGGGTTAVAQPIPEASPVITTNGPPRSVEALPQ